VIRICLNRWKKGIAKLYIIMDLRQVNICMDIMKMKVMEKVLMNWYWYRVREIV